MMKKRLNAVDATARRQLHDRKRKGSGKREKTKWEVAQMEQRGQVEVPCKAMPCKRRR